MGLHIFYRQRFKIPGRASRWCVTLGVAGFLAAIAGVAIHWPARAAQPASAQADARSPVAQYHEDVEPLLKKYCYACHADGASSGQVAFDALKTETEILGPALWFKVLRNTRSGIMPPPDQPRPTAAEHQKLERWIKASAFKSDPQHPDPGRVTLRRLNRTEYRNSIRDLLGIDFDVQAALPPDDVGYGFDNIGDVLSLSPTRMEKFIEAAIAAVDKGVPMDTVAISSQMILPGQFVAAADPKVTGDRLSFYKKQQVSHTFRAKHTGEYRIRISSKVDGDSMPDPQKVRVRASSGGKVFFTQDYKWSDADYFDDATVVRWEAGEHDVSVATEPLFDLQPLPSKMDYKILFMVIEGPLDRAKWEHPPGYFRFYTREAPPPAADKTGRRAYAGEILGRFVTKAFRRPVPADSLERLVDLAEKNYSLPGVPFEKGIAQAMVAVLASPRFLFHLETTEPLAAGERYPKVDEYTLASRLSFALWCSIPDEELTGLAARGALRQNFDAQVRRMLADPKANGFVESFANQWLQSRDVLDIPINSADVMAQEAPPSPATAPATGHAAVVAAPAGASDVVEAAPAVSAPGENGADAAVREGDRPRGGRAGRGAEGAVAGGARGAGGRGGRNRGPAVAPGTVLTPEIRAAMKQEVEAYFAHIMRGNRSVLEFLQSDYTFVNEALAPVYGISNVTGPDMRLVQLPPADPRGGVLTMGGVLTVTSNPTRTSPVKRGKWILQNILGTPPAPPPPNIPALEESGAKVTDRKPTQRELLAIHREDPMCASCHLRMDPLGLAFENFNAFGRYRTTEFQQPIEAQGELASGEKFNSVRELKRFLVDNHRDEFYRTLAEKLLTYVLGRGCEYYDVATIDAIVERMQREDGRFSSLLFGVLESAPFQQRRPAPHPPHPATSATGEPHTPNEGGVPK